MAATDTEPDEGASEVPPPAADEAAGVDDPAERTPSARFESSPWGRALLSMLIAFVAVMMVLGGMPDSTTKRAYAPVITGFTDLTALHQNWTLFAPSPRATTLRLEARLVYADGTEVAWHVPEGDPFVGTYRWWRWRKWSNFLLSADRERLWEPAAAWLARTQERDGAYPVEVTLVRQRTRAPELPSGPYEMPPFEDDEVLETFSFDEDGPP